MNTKSYLTNHADTDSERLAHEVEGGASGALAGVVLGTAAGPQGMVAGAIVGGVAGVIAGAALDTESSRQVARTRVLDAEIGISGGDLGAPNLVHPPSASARASDAPSDGGVSVVDGGSRPGER